MITQETLDFFAGPVVGALATANVKLEPWFTRTILVEAKAGATTLDVYFPKVTSERPLADIRENSRAAVVVVDITNFKSRQYKGKIIGKRDATGDDISRMQAQHARPVPVFLQFWGQGAADGWQRYVVDPAVCVTMEIEAIFDQTPKPGAGARIA